MTIRAFRPVYALLAGAVVAALPAVTSADEKPRMPGVRFPFTEEQARTFQDDYAKAAMLPKEVTNSVGMKLVLIPPGPKEHPVEFPL